MCNLTLEWGYRKMSHNAFLENVALAVIAMSTVSMATPVLAADVAAPTVASDDGGLGEIVVTARRVRENLQETPIAVTAIGLETLDNLSITNIAQVYKLAPNLQFSAGPSGSGASANFFIRGIGQVDFIATSDPGVSVYLDGVYVGRTVGAALDTADIESVEVLKGPQGTLFGKNTIGGAINIRSAKPGPNVGGYVEATVGNYGRYDGKFVANVPLADNLYFKLSGVTRNNDGFSKRDIDGVRLGDDNDVSGRIQLRWLPDDKTEVLLSADATRRRAHLAAHSNLATVPSASGAAYLATYGLNVMDFGPSSNPRKISTTGVRPTDDLDTVGIAVELNRNLGFAELRSISAYRRLDNQAAADFDGTELPYNDQLFDQRQSQYSQELQLLGSADGFKWILGAYYLRENVFQNTLNFDGGVTFYPPGSPPTQAITGVTRTIDLSTDSFALFAQGTYNLTDKLSTTLGLRWTHESKDVTIFNEIGQNGSPFEADDKTSWSNISPRFGLEYQASDNAMAYVSATRGFKSGSYNGRPELSSQVVPYEPEKVWTYELGMKTQMLDNRVRINSAAFYTQYKAIQLISGALDANGNLFFPVTNAGDIDVRGFEIELQARPARGLDVNASVGFADEKWQKIYPLPIPLVNTSTRLPSMSHWNATLGGQYSIPAWANGNIVIGGNYNYRSGYYQTVFNSSREKQNGFSMVDAFIMYEPDGKSWQIKFWGKNLTDSNYLTWGQDLVAFGNSHATGWFGRPREYGMTLRINM